MFYSNQIAIIQQHTLRFNDLCFPRSNPLSMYTCGALLASIKPGVAHNERNNVKMFFFIIVTDLFLVISIGLKMFELCKIMQPFRQKKLLCRILEGEKNLREFTHI